MTLRRSPSPAATETAESRELPGSGPPSLEPGWGPAADGWQADGTTSTSTSGAAPAEGQPDTATSWKLLEAPEPWVVVLVVLPLSFAIAWRAYAREHLSSGARGLLVGLRWLSLLALLTILARPVQVRSQERVTPAQILVLADDSASMSRRDAYTGAEQQAEALAALVGSGSDVASSGAARAAVAETTRAEPRRPGSTGSSSPTSSAGTTMRSCCASRPPRRRWPRPRTSPAAVPQPISGTRSARPWPNRADGR